MRVALSTLVFIIFNLKLWKELNVAGYFLLSESKDPFVRSHKIITSLPSVSLAIFAVVTKFAI